MDLSQSLFSSTLIDDWLSILIGFSGIMLVLSLLVTAIVKIFENLFVVRPRILKKAVTAFLKKVLSDKTEEVREQLVDETLRSPIEDLLWFDKPLKWGKTVSYVDADMLCERVTRILHGDGDSPLVPKEISEKADALIARGKESVRKLFAQYEAQMTNIFTRRIRAISIIAALVVAIVFQVDAFALLRQLSSDQEFREQAVALAERSQETYAESVRLEEDYSNISEQAFEILTARHSDLDIAIEKTTGSETEKDNILAEFMLNVELYAEKEYPGIEREMDDLLDSLYTDYTDKLIVQARELTAELALVDLRPWKEGSGFYGFSQGGFAGWFWRMIGVLFATVLISFGAPFWNETLSRLLRFRDALKPSGKKTEKEGKKDK